MEAIDKINQRLKDASIPVRVGIRGKALHLRATLPVKDGTGRKQQDISLGVSASRDGLRRAELEAQQLGKAIALGTFRWEDYLKPKASPRDTLGDLVAEFKAYHMKRNSIQETTWRETWQRTFDQLPQAEPLNEGLILAVLLSTDANTRQRELAYQRLQRLSDYAGLEIDLKPYKGNYSAKSLEPRYIPSNSEIEQHRELIPSVPWQWGYGMLATFGLRPHELYFANFQDAHTIYVSRGKTGSRIVRALPPDWVKDWHLQELEAQRPKASGKTYRAYGQRVSRQFDRYQLPLVAYDLRHAYAIRGSVTMGLPLSTMSEMMGHSV